MKHSKQAFTLIELLVVICIIAILASMLLPALQSARESASSATCVSNLGQFSKAFQMYVASYNDYMPMLTDYQSNSGSCSWEYALIDALGQDRDKSPFSKSFYCDADSSGEPGSGKKSYSLNNLQEVVHPRIPMMLGANGKVVKDKKAAEKGYISGNRTTAVYAASDLIIIGENVSSNNRIGSANFSKSGSGYNLDSPGSASAVHQYVSIKMRITSHKTAGNLFLDGHATHAVPEKTLSSTNAVNLKKYHTPTETETTPAAKYNSTNPTGISEYGFGCWTDCIQGKLDTGKSKDCDGSCHAKK